MELSVRSAGPFGGAYRGRRVLVTGHTGFKGSWLALWLHRMGADVSGISLAPDTTPSHWELLGLEIAGRTLDIRDTDRLAGAVAELRPEIIFHLAAQPLVRRGFREPVATFATNVMGVANLLEAVRSTPSVRAVVVVTSDKCYDNRDTSRGYREGDMLGGHDPYSASKGCAELVASSYRASFFTPTARSGRHVGIATARAGNVIGGGDWAQDRLVPDLVRAVTTGTRLALRYPNATRPWQHVLESLSGYLALGQHLLLDAQRYAQAWNFGPHADDHPTVAQMVECFARHWPAVQWQFDDTQAHVHEARLLHLDCAKARSHLGWSPVWNSDQAIARTVRWYRQWHEEGRAGSAADIDQYLADARAAGCAWAAAPSELAEILA